MNKRRLIEAKLLNLTQQFLYQAGIGIRKAQLNISLQKHLGLSSLDRLELFLEIEKEFQFTFTDEMLTKIDTLRDVVDLLCTKPFRIQEYYSIPKKQKHSVAPEKTQTLIELLMLYAHKEPARQHIFSPRKGRGSHHHLWRNYEKRLGRSARPFGTGGRAWSERGHDVAKSPLFFLCLLWRSPCRLYPHSTRAAFR
jgi:acyl carrier protein